MSYGVEDPEPEPSDCPMGDCYGAPPSVVVFNGLLESQFPRTHEEWFCGSFSPAIPQPDPAPSPVDDE